MKTNLISVVAVAILGLLGFFGYDIVQDRQNSVFTEDSVPAYADWTPYPSAETKPKFILPPKICPKVKRIRYGKDYMAVKVESKDGEIGWVFYGHAFRISRAR